MGIQLEGVMETLLITLYIRAKDAMSTNPVINDKKAAEMVQKIDYDFSKFDSPWSYYGVLATLRPNLIFYINVLLIKALNMILLKKQMPNLIGA